MRWAARRRFQSGCDGPRVSSVPLTIQALFLELYSPHFQSLHRSVTLMARSDLLARWFERFPMLIPNFPTSSSAVRLTAGVHRDHGPIRSRQDRVGPPTVLSWVPPRRVLPASTALRRLRSRAGMRGTTRCSAAALNHWGPFLWRAAYPNELLPSIRSLAAGRIRRPRKA